MGPLGRTDELTVCQTGLALAYGCVLPTKGAAHTASLCPGTCVSVHAHSPNACVCMPFACVHPHRQKDALRQRSFPDPEAQHELARLTLQLAKWTAAQVGPRPCNRCAGGPQAQEGSIHRRACVRLCFWGCGALVLECGCAIRGRVLHLLPCAASGAFGSDKLIVQNRCLCVAHLPMPSKTKSPLTAVLLLTSAACIHCTLLPAHAQLLARWLPYTHPTARAVRP